MIVDARQAIEVEERDIATLAAYDRKADGVVGGLRLVGSFEARG